MINARSDYRLLRRPSALYARQGLERVGRSYLRLHEHNSPGATHRKGLPMQFKIVIHDRFFDTERQHHVEATDIDEAIEIAFDLVGHGLPVYVEVSDGYGTSASFSINEGLNPIETKVLILDRQRNTFVEVIVQAKTAHDAVAKAVENRLDSEVVAIDAGNETEWWIDASQTSLPQPWDLLKPRRRPTLQILSGGVK